MHVKHFVTIRIERCRKLVFASRSLATLTSFRVSGKYKKKKKNTLSWIQNYCYLILKDLPSIHWHCLCEKFKVKFEDRKKFEEEWVLWIGRKEWIVYAQKLYHFCSKHRYWFQMIYSCFSVTFLFRVLLTACIEKEKKKSSLIQTVLRTRCFSRPGSYWCIVNKPFVGRATFCSRSTVHSKRTTMCFFYASLCETLCSFVFFSVFFFFVPYLALLRVQLSTKILSHQNFTSQYKKKHPVPNLILTAGIVSMDVSATTIRNCPLPF